MYTNIHSDKMNFQLRSQFNCLYFAMIFFSTKALPLQLCIGMTAANRNYSWLQKQDGISMQILNLYVKNDSCQCLSYAIHDQSNQSMISREYKFYSRTSIEIFVQIYKIFSQYLNIIASYFTRAQLKEISITFHSNFTLHKNHVLKMAERILIFFLHIVNSNVLLYEFLTGSKPKIEQKKSRCKFISHFPSTQKELPFCLILSRT